MSCQTSTIQRDRDAVLIPLSKLVPAGRRNPRRVKPERYAHRRLVASIRAHGLLQPLVVRPVVVTGDKANPGRPGAYRVTAGHRRLAVLREVHRGDDAVRVPCVVRPAENDEAADAQALAENFAREPMHPLDEATAFAKLARDDGRDADAIAADFGVTPGYVRQRMKLADLSDAVQSAYRAGEIDTATAEAFAAVPPERQAAVWAEVGVPGPLTDCPVDTTRCALDLVLKGHMGRFPAVKIILPHGGGFLPYVATRLAELSASLHKDRSAEQFKADMRRFYFDTALVAESGLPSLQFSRLSTT